MAINFNCGGDNARRACDSPSTTGQLAGVDCFSQSLLLHSDILVERPPFMCGINIVRPGCEPTIRVSGRFDLLTALAAQLAAIPRH